MTHHYTLLLFAYGVYLGGFLGTLSRQAQEVMTADTYDEVSMWPSLVIQPTLWPVFFIGTVLWILADTYGKWRA